MASDKPKLSLRRKKKETVAQTGSAPVSNLAPLVDVATDKVGGVSSSVDGRGSEERDNSDDFRPDPSSRAGVGRKRRSPQSETAGHLDLASEDQLQLALAMSASLQPHSALLQPHSALLQPEPAAPPRRKRARYNRSESLPANLLATSSAERETLLAQRASEILQEGGREGQSVVSGSGQLQPSQLGRLVRETQPGSTLWEMAGYAEKETHSKFVVPALDLPASESRSSPSPQPSPASHTPRAQSPRVTLSPQRSPSHNPHSPRHSPSSQSQISHSPQHSSSTHPLILHSSPTAPPQPSHTHISSRAPILPRGVQTLLSDLSSLVGSQLCSDVIITVDDGRGIPAHSAILACRCPMLAERLFHSLDKPVRLNFRQHSRGTVVSFLRYLYTGTIPAIGQNGIEAVKMLAVSLGMVEPTDDREEQHPLVQAHTSDSGARIKPPSSSLPHPHTSLPLPLPQTSLNLHSSVPQPTGRHGSRASLTSVLSPHHLPSRAEATPPSHDSLPTSSSQVVQSSQRAEVISVSSSPGHSSPSSPSPQPHHSHSPTSQGELHTSSPLPLRERLFSKPHPSVGVAHTQSHDQVLAADQQAAGAATPVSTGQRPVLESDVDITPMPDYTNMDTPGLKGECSRFGVRALPKKKMIAKLTEIYDYTHPLTDEDGNIVSEQAEVAMAAGGKKKVGAKTKGRKKDPAMSQEKPSLEEVAEKVREVITKDTKLYEDILQYKPLELSHIQSRLKAAALPLSKDTLMDTLDHLCITFSVPRQSHQKSV